MAEGPALTPCERLKSNLRTALEIHDGVRKFDEVILGLSVSLCSINRQEVHGCFRLSNTLPVGCSQWLTMPQPACLTRLAAACYVLDRRKWSLVYAVRKLYIEVSVRGALRPRR